MFRPSFIFVLVEMNGSDPRVFRSEQNIQQISHSPSLFESLRGSALKRLLSSWQVSKFSISCGKEGDRIVQSEASAICCKVGEANTTSTSISELGAIPHRMT